MRKRKVIIVIPIIICLVCISALIIWRHVLPKKTGDMQGIDKITLSENLYIEPSGAEHIVQNRDTGIQYYDNEMILYVQTDTTVTEIEQLALNYDAKLTGANEYINMYLIRFSEAKSYETLINIQNELLKMI